MGWRQSDWWALTDVEKDDWLLFFEYRRKVAKDLREQLSKEKQLTPEAFIPLALIEANLS